MNSAEKNIDNCGHPLDLKQSLGSKCSKCGEIFLNSNGCKLLDETEKEGVIKAIAWLRDRADGMPEIVRSAYTIAAGILYHQFLGIKGGE